MRLDKSQGLLLCKANDATSNMANRQINRGHQRANKGMHGNTSEQSKRHLETTVLWLGSAARHVLGGKSDEITCAQTFAQ